jgi:hypothetical protein
MIVRSGTLSGVISGTKNAPIAEAILGSIAPDSKQNKYLTGGSA